MKKSLTAVLLADDKPGHFHLAEGVLSAIGRLADVQVRRVEVRRRRWLPPRALGDLANLGASASMILNLGYGLKLSDLPQADLVVSAGGNTLGANVAASRALKAANVFVGSLRRFRPQDFSVVITSYARYFDLPRHLVCLKPSNLDPEAIGRPLQVPIHGSQNPPKTALLLLGGNTPDFRYEPAEWQTLLGLLEQMHDVWGTTWLVSNSRRTPVEASKLFSQTAGGSSAIRQFIDVRNTAPGGLGRLLSKADIVFCTADSSSMISEAIAARLPVIGLTPQFHSYNANEGEYRRMLQKNNWTRTIDIAALNLESIDLSLSEIRPMKENHLDQLAKSLKQRLPELLG